MTRKELDGLVTQGENAHVEFKTKAAHPDKILKEFVAFANTRGGHLLIGVDDDGRISGLNNPEEEAEVMEQALSSKCRPKLKYRYQLIPISRKKSVIHYQIFESRNKPHFVIDNSGKGFKNAYVRIKDMSVKASREIQEILRRKKRRRNLSFTYGDTEKILLQHLQNNDSVTLNKFCDIARISKRKASNVLVIMVLADIIKIIPSEDEDLFLSNLK